MYIYIKTFMRLNIFKMQSILEILAIENVFFHFLFPLKLVLFNN